MEAVYGRTARLVHWLVAALVVIVVALGWAMEDAAHGSAARATLLLLHRSFGLTIFGLMVFRALWRWRHEPPPLPASVAPYEAWLARATHAVLYLLLLTMPVAGYVTAAAAGDAVDLFGVVAIPPLLPQSERLAQLAVAAHLAGQYLIYLFVALHVAGALVHGAVRRDAVFDRMAPPRRQA